MGALAVILEIRSMDPPGRFLCKTVHGDWTLHDEKSVLTKTKQALRERPSPRSKSPLKNVITWISRKKNRCKSRSISRRKPAKLDQFLSQGITVIFAISLYQKD